MVGCLFHMKTCVFASLGVRLTSLEMALVSLGVGLVRELGDEFEGDLDEFDEFWGPFSVCLLHLGMHLLVWRCF